MNLSFDNLRVIQIFFYFPEVVPYTPLMSNLTPTTYRAYVDGSFKGRICRWAVIVIDDDDEVVMKRCGVLRGPVTEMAQIGGELKAAMEAVRFAKQTSTRVTIYHDYTGIYEWVAELFGGKSWRRKKRWTQDYADYMTRNRAFVDKFVKVPAHSGDRWNEAVDQLAAGAA
jgi:ribonuclease HI